MSNPVSAECHIRGRRKACLPDSREVLLGVAKDIFFRKGLQGTTIRDITQVASFSSTMIYYHFGGKEGIACTLAQQAAIDLLCELAVFQSKCSEHAQNNVSMQGVSSLLYAHLGYESILGRFTRDPAIRRFPKLREAIEQTCEEIHDRLLSCMEAEQAAGSLRSDLDLEIIASRLLSQAVACRFPPQGGGIRQHRRSAAPGGGFLA